MTEQMQDACLLLKKAAKQFREYEKLHDAKGTEESRKKAFVNGSFAIEIEDFLSQSGWLYR